MSNENVFAMKILQTLCYIPSIQADREQTACTIVQHWLKVSGRFAKLLICCQRKR